jgi:hypothetical protein
MANLRAARKTCCRVTGKEARDEVKVVWDRARSASDENDGIDPHAGIAHFERYLEGLG